LLASSIGIKVAFGMTPEQKELKREHKEEMKVSRFVMSRWTGLAEGHQSWQPRRTQNVSVILIGCHSFLSMCTAARLPALRPSARSTRLRTRSSSRS
jgi:hypothetical protein